MQERVSAAFPIFYFPPISWFAAALHEKQILLDIDSVYRKQRFTTRTLIKGPNGLVPLVLPVGRRGHQKKIREKEISFRENWPTQHWRSILFSYKNSPYFEYYEEDLKECFQNPSPKLIDQLLKVLEKVFAILNLPIAYHLSSEEMKEVDRDYRKDFSTDLAVRPKWFQAEAYEQVFGEFEPNLSILDLICNVGPESPLMLTRAYQSGSVY
ncbi:MAG: WbqC family protein [Bacteroidota bacterium]